MNKLPVFNSCTARLRYCTTFLIFNNNTLEYALRFCQKHLISFSFVFGSLYYDNMKIESVWLSGQMMHLHVPKDRENGRPNHDIRGDRLIFSTPVPPLPLLLSGVWKHIIMMESFFLSPLLPRFATSSIRKIYAYTNHHRNLRTAYETFTEWQSRVTLRDFGKPRHNLQHLAMVDSENCETPYGIFAHTEDRMHGACLLKSSFIIKSD